MKLLSRKPAFFPSSFIFCYLLVQFHDNNVAAISLPKNETVPAFFVFGDSIVDTGNNNKLITPARCNFQPYGRDFKGGRPTGRFSNGRAIPDLLAEGFGVKELLPAYLDPNLQLQDLLTGVSFASGGAGYDLLTSEIASALSLSDQIEMLKNYTKRVIAEVGEDRTQIILSKSIFMVCLGSNDIGTTYSLIPVRRLQFNISAYTDLMLSSASNFLRELYGLGVRRIGVISIPPIGCTPFQRTVGGGIQRICVESQNQAAVLFNSKLSTEMVSLNRKLPDARLVYIDSYYLLLDIIQHPAQYGFEVVDKGCCGTGHIEVTYLCNRYNPFTCTDDSKYIFWDSFHPTEAASKTIIAQVLKNNINKFF